MAPDLAGKGSPTDTLFVFARETSGPPMPVSIVRATRKDLPFTFQLDDSTSPMPSGNSPAQDQWSLWRVSQSPARRCPKVEI